MSPIRHSGWSADREPTARRSASGHRPSASSATRHNTAGYPIDAAAPHRLEVADLVVVGRSHPVSRSHLRDSPTSRLRSPSSRRTLTVDGEVCVFDQNPVSQQFDRPGGHAGEPHPRATAGSSAAAMDAVSCSQTKEWVDRRRLVGPAACVPCGPALDAASDFGSTVRGRAHILVTVHSGPFACGMVVWRHRLRREVPNGQRRRRVARDGPGRARFSTTSALRRRICDARLESTSRAVSSDG